MRKKNISLASIAVVLMCIKYISEQSTVIPYSALIDNIIIGVYIIVSLLLLIKSKYSITSLITIFIVTIIILYSSIVTKNNAMLITFIFWISFRNIELNKIVNIMFQTYIAVVAVHLGLTFFQSILGNIELGEIVSGKFRYSFGFNHPNSFAAVVLSIGIMYLWINYEKLKVKHYLMVLVLNMITFLFAKSRTSFLCAVLCVFLVMKSKKESMLFEKAMQKVTSFLFPILCVINFICAKQYLNGNSLVRALDILLTGRIRLISYALNRSGISLFGKEIDYIGAIGYQQVWDMSIFTFDSLYSLLLVNIGVVYIALFSILFYKIATKNSIKENVFLIMWMLYGITEVTALNGFALFPIFILKKMFVNNKSVKKENSLTMN